MTQTLERDHVSRSLEVEVEYKSETPNSEEEFRIDRRAKYAAFLLSIPILLMFYGLPNWLDQSLSPWEYLQVPTPATLRLLALVLRDIIVVSWWVFLVTFVMMNTFLVFWAGLGYRFTGRTRTKSIKLPILPVPSPSVAVVIPVFNEETNLAKTLDSVINQTYQRITQIILVDDGSTDATAQIAERYVGIDGRIKYLRHNENMGKAAALNTGFSFANAELSFFMDGDSYIEANAIGLMVPHFSDPEVGAVAGLIVIHNNGTLLAKCQEIEYYFTQLVARFCQSQEKTVLICPGAGTMVRTRAAHEILHSSRTITEDADFTFQIHRRWRISQEPHAFSYTEGMTSYSALKNQRVRWFYGVLQTITLHKWAMRKLWVLWAWVGYALSPFTFAVLLLLPLMFYILGTDFLVFFVGYNLLAGFFAWILYALPLLWHPKPSKKLVLFVPFFFVYQGYLNIIQFFCIVSKIVGRGVKVFYGPRLIHTI